MKNKNDIIVPAAVIFGIVGFIAAVIYFRGGTASDRPSVGSGDQSKTTTAGSGEFDNLLNKPIPVFSFADRSGTVYSSENLRGKKVVLFFTEGLMCYPACWNQIAAFGKDKRFSENDIITLSVVIDSPADWDRAIRKMPELAQAKVVFDKNAFVSRTFGMLTVPSSMHYGVYPGHTYVIIDREGIGRFVFDDPAMAIQNDKLAEELKKLE